MQLEAARQVPFPLSEVVWNYQLMSDQQASVAEQRAHQILFLAAKETDVRNRLRLFQEAGIEPHLIQSDCMALHNLMTFEFLENPAEGLGPQDCIAAIDIGTTATNLVISGRQLAWCRTLALGGNDFTNALVRKFQLTHQQAEQLKEMPTRGKAVHRIYAELDPHLTRFAREVVRSFDFFASQFHEFQLRHVWCMGGGSDLHGLLHALRFCK